MRSPQRQNRRVAPKWQERIREGLFEAGGPFEIDSIVRDLATKKKLRPGHWADIEDAIAFSRRGLNVAMEEAATAELDRAAPLIDSWEPLAEAAIDAERAIRRLLLALVIDAEPAAKRKPPTSANAIRRGVRFSAALEASPGIDRDREAPDMAEALWRTAQFTKRLKLASSEIVRKLREKHWKEGDPAFRAFSVTIGVTWACLTGQRPTAHQAGGPFILYLAAAWRDAGGSVKAAHGDDVGQFIHGARAARENLPPDALDALLKLGRPDWAFGPIDILYYSGRPLELLATQGSVRIP